MFRKKILLAIAACIPFILLATSPLHAKVHKYRITAEEAYGGMLESTIPPVLSIESGDSVNFNTIMLYSGKLAPDMSIGDILKMRQDGVPVYAFTGPFYIKGAEPGDVLEVRIKKIVPGDYSLTYIYPDSLKLGGLPEGYGFTDGYAKTLRLSADKKTAEFKPGIVLPVRPFLGTMALSPKPGEKRPPAVPDYFAGNLDNKELVQGTTLFVPVSVPGALFMAADAHSMQGDGEVCITAAETYFEEVELEFIVRKDMKLERPMAETPTHWITMGMHKDLNEAMRIALRDAIDFLAAKKSLTKEEAYVLCSLAVDFRVTQIVDGNKGIHGMIPKNIFQQ